MGPMGSHGLVREGELAVGEWGEVSPDIESANHLLSSHLLLCLFVVFLQDVLYEQLRVPSMVSCFEN